MNHLVIFLLTILCSSVTDAFTVKTCRSCCGGGGGGGSRISTRPKSTTTAETKRRNFSIVRADDFVPLSGVTVALKSTEVDDDVPYTSETSATTTKATDVGIEESMELLKRAATTKSEDPDRVVDALLDLEKTMRQRNKEHAAQSDRTLQALSGGTEGRSWRLIFTTGTKETQKKTGRKINYFPVRATQSFRQTDNNDTAGEQQELWKIENGLYLGSFPVIKFRGDFDWTLLPSGVTKLTFDFTSVLLMGTWDIQLKRGEAASFGAKSGLGSSNNVKLEQIGKRPFFNWISADDDIATARGGGGGLALWKRVDYEGP